MVLFITRLSVVTLETEEKYNSYEERKRLSYYHRNDKWSKENNAERRVKKNRRILTSATTAKSATSVKYKAEDINLSEERVPV